MTIVLWLIVLAAVAFFAFIALTKGGGKTPLSASALAAKVDATTASDTTTSAET